MKKMLNISFDKKGTVHFEIIPQGWIVNQAYYVEILRLLCEDVCRKRYELWRNNRIFQYDKAPAYKVLSVKQLLVKKLITEMEHPSYSLDFASNDNWLFLKVFHLKGMMISVYWRRPKECDNGT
jgi:hypothetical protein